MENGEQKINGTEVSNEQPGSIQQRLRTSRRIIKSLKAKADSRRTKAEKIADWMTATFGSISFLTLNCIWFLVWIILNINIIPDIRPFDIFPFGLLTMIVSLEAIVLSIFVLISQNRAAKIYDLREEIDLQIDIITEQEVTKIMELVAMLAEREGIDLSQDKTLKNMLKPTDTNKLEKILEKQHDKIS